mmetsp:Transcript_5920/g.15070  ORF Transcript_5920/g.15070 Transcript_5920/m.15070 type:complete len:276 (-) Transcript_5920:79-906(-)|eukprot:CAMPEP_0177651618 /NCGR_PEP_ID=MMETSP0447-20121125/12658_1 /TAXON_ID=0 /ORGANISM="Stygamoeba regulata, Strain BSH-02190019" /LENGTH=275 /DNA_ID=CAMNT_0019154739 /DNA_START=66 /DNA_END=893 /DNA_ORIENTATION=+
MSNIVDLVDSVTVGKRKLDDEKRVLENIRKKRNALFQREDHRPLKQDNISERNAWLLKVPEFLNEEFRKAAPSTEFGFIRETITRDSNGTEKKQYSFHLSAQVPDRMDLPREYNVDLMAPSTHTRIFSQEIETGEKAFEGTVNKQGGMKPRMDDVRYHTLMQHMVDEADNRPIQASIPSLARTEPVQPIESASRKKSYIARTRMEREDAVPLLLALFNEHGALNLTTLENLTNQPTPYLKELLREYCIYNKSGVNKRKYELKPEYKLDVQQEETL